MTIVLTFIHIVVCFFLILVVLLQTGKGADLGGAFGGGGSQTALGNRGAATLLSKLTTTSAVLFMLTSLTLAIVATRQAPSVMDQVDEVSGPATAGADLGVPAAVPPDAETAAPETAGATLPEGTGETALPVESPAGVSAEVEAGGEQAP